MNIMTYPTLEVATKKLAERIKQEVDKNELYTIALTGGLNAPKLYQALAEEEIDWAKVHIFFAHEVLTGPQKGFNYQLAKGHLFDKAPIDPSHIHPLPLDLDDSEAIREQYTELVTQIVPTLGNHHRFNIVLLEMHDDGHVAGYYPGDEEFYHDESAYLVKPRPQDKQLEMTLGCEAMGAAKSLVFYAFSEKLRFVVGDIVNLMPQAKLYPSNYLMALFPWSYIYTDGDAMREKSYAIY